MFDETDNKNTNPEAVNENSQQEESCKEKLLKLSADFENFKRRVIKERAEWMSIAETGILEDLLPIFDELDRAIGLAEKTEDSGLKAWVEGLKLVQKNWQKKFTDLAIKEIDTTGEFNPEYHEALMQVEDPTKQSGHIVQTFSKGYTFKGKVVKHAQVSVAK